jgi:hypothetical protein
LLVLFSMHTLIILIILAGNYSLSFLLFSYYHTIRLLTLDKELRSSLLPGWNNLLLVTKILLYITTAVYLVMSVRYLEYLLAYTIISLVLNGLGPVSYSLVENLVVRSACKRRHLYPKLDIFLTLVGEDGEINPRLDGQRLNQRFPLIVYLKTYSERSSVRLSSLTPLWISSRNGVHLHLCKRLHNVQHLF